MEGDAVSPLGVWVHLMAGSLHRATAPGTLCSHVVPVNCSQYPRMALVNPG